MKILKISLATILAVMAASLTLAPTFAEEPKPDATTAAPEMNDPAMMKQMMELAQLNENHKLLAELAGDWTYTVKMWMAPGAPAMESAGTADRKPFMGGRYFLANFNGEMKMPGEDGKLKNFKFKGMSIEGYDNVQKKFVATWCDNMSTGVMLTQGTYDAASKTFTYTGEVEMMPGMKTKVREVIKIVDANHHNFEWYEDRGGQEAKTMEISYTRKK